MEVTICNGKTRTTYKATNVEVVNEYIVLYGEQNQYEEYMDAVIKFGGQFFWESELLWADLPIRFVERIDNRNE